MKFTGTVNSRASLNIFSSSAESERETRTSVSAKRWIIFSSSSSQQWRNLWFKEQNY